jgi:large subunit ribosomal protein L23
MNMIGIKYDLLIQPVMTEKSNILGEKGKYVLKVALKSNKFLVKKTVEKIFDVKVKTVNILMQKGKLKRFKDIKGRRPNIKKAIITLEKGHNINLTGGIK